MATRLLIPAPCAAWHTALASVHEGAPHSRGVSRSRTEGRPGMHCQVPPGGDASWLVLVRAPRIPMRQRGRFAPLLQKEPGCTAPPLPSPCKASSGNAAGTKVFVIPDILLAQNPG